MTGENLFALEIPSIGNHGHILNTHRGAGFFGHAGQLIPIDADIGHLMGHDQVMLGINCRLYGRFQ